MKTKQKKHGVGEAPTNVRMPIMGAFTSID